MDKMALIKNAKRLKEIVAEVAQSVEAQTWNRLAELLKERNQIVTDIRVYLAFEADVVIIEDEEAFQTLKNISDGTPVGLQHASDDLEKAAPGIKHILLGDLADDHGIPLDDEKVTDLASDHFYSWFSGEDYVLARYDTPAVILSADVHPKLADFFSQARNCWCFQQYQAAMVMSRAALEASLWVLNARRIYGNAPVEALAKHPDFSGVRGPKALMDGVVPEEDDLYSAVMAFYEHTRGAAHPFPTGPREGRGKQASQSIREAARIVNELFRRYG